LAASNSSIEITKSSSANSVELTSSVFKL
jgi:hypothetical protein